jgi:hypothetical protein
MLLNPMHGRKWRASEGEEPMLGIVIGSNSRGIFGPIGIAAL